MTRNLVDLVRPVGYLCAGGVLGVGSLLLPGGGPAPVPPPAVPAAARAVTPPGPPWA